VPAVGARLQFTPEVSSNSRSTLVRFSFGAFRGVLRGMDRSWHRGPGHHGLGRGPGLWRGSSRWAPTAPELAVTVASPVGGVGAWPQGARAATAETQATTLKEAG
jgi:hypothetical protein